MKASWAHNYKWLKEIHWLWDHAESIVDKHDICLFACLGVTLFCWYVLAQVGNDLCGEGPPGVRNPMTARHERHERRLGTKCGCKRVAIGKLCWSFASVHCCLLLNPIVQKKTGPSGLVGENIYKCSHQSHVVVKMNTTRRKRDKICAFCATFSVEISSANTYTHEIQHGYLKTKSLQKQRENNHHYRQLL